MVFFGGAALLLFGCHRMASYGNIDDPEAVSEFLIGVSLASVGFLISWASRKEWPIVMLLVALGARIVCLPMEPGENFKIRAWEGEVANAGKSPYALAPNDPELDGLRIGEWEGLTEIGETSQQAPLALLAFRFFDAFSLSEVGGKLVFVLCDLAICLLLWGRFGASGALLYGWNPLAIYCSAGVGVFEPVSLLPIVAGFWIWDAWVDRKGGVVVINANGGISGGLGQMVCFSSFLVGLGVASNFLFLPLLLWILWHTTRKAGLTSGFWVILVGGAPVAATLLWVELTWGLTLENLGAMCLPHYEGGTSLVPWALNRLLAPAEIGLVGLAWALVALVVISIARCHSMQRFGSVYLFAVMVFLPDVFPWYFLCLAPFAIGAPHFGYRLGCIAAFAYFVGGSEMKNAAFALFWLPFALGSLWYVAQHRESKDGMYVRSY